MCLRRIDVLNYAARLERRMLWNEAVEGGLLLEYYAIEEETGNLGRKNPEGRLKSPTKLPQQQTRMRVP